jgi:hypothetical protein
MSSELLDKTYIYTDIEVKLTGRCATKPKNITRGTVTKQPDVVLYEITPVDKDMEWTKWVKVTDMYVVDDITSEHEDLE